MDNELKVFKMNDYEWWVTNGYAEDLNDYYNEHIGENSIDDVELCDLNKDGMWYKTNDKEDIEALGDSDEMYSVESKETQFGDLMRKDDDVYKFISFREALAKVSSFTEPYCIASTEW